MSTKTYSIVEIFYTLQGEGMQSGRPAMFIRFGGCNIWSGHDKDRLRDQQRNQANCATFCDTDFRHAKKKTVDEILEQIDLCKKNAGIECIDYFVLTGGEPALQVDSVLLEKLASSESAEIAIETNGTVNFKEGVQDRLDWICVSPKCKDEDIVIREGDELKVVFPSYHPNEFVALAKGFKHKLVQPCADTSEVGRSLLSKTHQELCIRFCKENLGWRLSIQTHKILGLP